MQSIPATSEPLRILGLYEDGIAAAGRPCDLRLARVIRNHLADLAALAREAARNVADVAGQPSRRAGRLDAVLAAINANFADPAFSIGVLARSEGVSARYLHDLLRASGASFGDRVIELRLQQAWRLLNNALHAHRKVSDIALSSGFNDVSYFHRSFRARFGMTPSDARASADAERQDPHID
jgi:AraC-like DNA-binding protein